MKINCLPVRVYRDARLGDCTNRGVSSMFDDLMLACESGPLSFESDQQIPLNFCMIERRRLWGYQEHVRVVPAAVNDQGKIVPRGDYWWMFGGNIARTSDSRLRELSGIDYAVDIHDRRE